MAAEYTYTDNTNGKMYKTKKHPGLRITELRVAKLVEQFSITYIFIKIIHAELYTYFVFLQVINMITW